MMTFLKLEREVMIRSSLSSLLRRGDEGREGEGRGKGREFHLPNRFLSGEIRRQKEYVFLSYSKKKYEEKSFKFKNGIQYFLEKYTQ